MGLLGVCIACLGFVCLLVALLGGGVRIFFLVMRRCWLFLRGRRLLLGVVLGFLRVGRRLLRLFL